MEQLLPLLLNGAGGAIIGPILSKLLGGKGATGLLAGIAGGLAGGYGMDAVGLQLLSGTGLVGMLGELLQGGVGGGILGGIIGLVNRAK
ncbi:MAG: hypothetical protein QNI84_09990 [Henriciella sp.]|nr:hypothetical protein [Henriciella sp.]